MRDEPNDRDPSKFEVAKTLADQLLNNPDFKRAVGKRTTAFILFTLAVATAELTVGLPIITLASTPVVGAVIAYLLGEVEDWIRSRKPSMVFFLCPEEAKFIGIAWSDLPTYRKRQACPDCGSPYITRCQVGRHFIVSPNPSKPSDPPRPDGFCPLCDPSLPKHKRRYLPNRAG